MNITCSLEEKVFSAAFYIDPEHSKTNHPPLYIEQAFYICSICSSESFQSCPSSEDVSRITFFLGPQKCLRSPLPIRPSGILNQRDTSILDPLGDIAPATGKKLPSPLAKATRKMGEG